VKKSALKSFPNPFEEIAGYVMALMHSAFQSNAEMVLNIHQRYCKMLSASKLQE
jgi:hypothetical protein